MGDMVAVKVWKNALCFIMGYLVAMEIGVTLLVIDAFFCMIHSIAPINVCTDFEINWHKIDGIYKTCKNRMFYLTLHDAKEYVVRRGGFTSDRYVDQDHFETNQKSLRLPEK